MPNSRRSPGTRALHWGIHAAFLALGLLVFYRDFFQTRFDLLPGNLGDARLIVVYLEHWWVVFHGGTTWDSMLMFYPLRHTLGMSDLLFLMGLPYSIFRLLGLDMFSALQATLVALSIAGYVSMAALLERGFRCRPPVAAAGALLFTVNINLYFEANHPQLLAVVLVPLVFHLALRFLETAPGGASKAVAAGAAFILLEGGLLCTAFYIGWAVIFFFALLAAIQAVKLKRTRRWRDVWRTLRAPLDRCGRWNWLFLILLLAVGGVFLWAYAPVVLEYGGRRYRDVFGSLPMLGSFVDLSPSNWLWGSILQWLFPARFVEPGPVRPWNGLPPVLLLGFLAALGYWRGWRRDGGRAAAGPATPLIPQAVWAGWLGLGVLLAWLLMLRVGPFSLWILPFNLFPGANGLRAVGRLQLVLIVPVIVVVALTVNDLWDRAAAGAGVGLRRVVRFALPAFAVLLAVEEIFAGPIGNFQKADQRALLRRVGQPPPQCRVFQLEPVAPPTGNVGVFYTMDAILIAYALRLPTMHGYTGVQVKSHVGMDPWSEGYLPKAAQWWAGHGIASGICALELDSGRWRAIK